MKYRERSRQRRAQLAEGLLQEVFGGPPREPPWDVRHSARILHFFIPLREPLGLPHGFAVDVELDEPWEAWEARAALLEHAVATDLAEDPAVQREPPAEGDRLPGPVRMVPCRMRFWRIAHSGRHVLGVRARQRLIRIILKGSGWRRRRVRILSLPQRWIVRRWLREPDDARSPRSLRRWVESSVAEVAVPIPGVLPDRESSAAVYSTAFDFGIARVRVAQQAYALASRTPVTPATRENLPPLIDALDRRWNARRERWEVQPFAFAVNMNVWPFTPAQELRDQGLAHVASVVSLFDRRSAFIEVPSAKLAALRALDRDGDYRSAVLLTSVASEMFLNELLGHLLWEEGWRPEAAGGLLDRREKLVQRVKSELPPRLGGSWALDGDLPTGRWHRDLHLVRHRVVHMGYEPDRHQAKAAFDAFEALEQFVAARLSNPQGLGAYPRTAFRILAEEGLRERNAWTKRVRSLVEDPTEPNWIDTYARWKAATELSTRTGRETAPAPDPVRAVVLAQLRADGSLRWLLHDREARMACPMAHPPTLMAPASRALCQLVAEAQAGSIDTPTSTVILGLRGVPTDVGGPWVHEYRVVPEGGVMVNRRDLDP